MVEKTNEMIGNEKKLMRCKSKCTKVKGITLCHVEERIDEEDGREEEDSGRRRSMGWCKTKGNAKV